MYVDLGANNPMTNNSGNLTDLKNYDGSDIICVGNGSKLAITHILEIQINQD